MTPISPALVRDCLTVSPFFLQTPAPTRPAGAATPLARAWRTYDRLRDAWNRLCEKEEDEVDKAREFYPPFPNKLMATTYPRNAPQQHNLFDVQNQIDLIRSQRRGRRLPMSPTLKHWLQIKAGLKAYKALCDKVDRQHGIHELRAEISKARKRMSDAERRLLKTPPQTLEDALIMLEWFGSEISLGDYDNKTRTISFPEASKKHDFHKRVLLTLINHLVRARAAAAH
jgi:hypothetical protein